MKFETNVHGTKYWRNDKGLFHHIIHPALTFRRNDKYWYRNGVIHRLDGPAEEFPDEQPKWYWLGKHITEQQHTLISNKSFFTKKVEI